MTEANISSLQTNKIGAPSNTVFILDTYNPHGLDKNDVRYTFSVNERKWAIKEVKLDWGLPQLKQTIDNETDPSVFHLFNTYEEALAAADNLVRLNRDR